MPEERRLILASASPRRHELLETAGIAHVVQPSQAPEDRLPGEPAIDFVKRIAEAKARAIKRTSSDVVLGADTVVTLADQVFGKPANVCDAMRMLRLLSGREHIVYTGICLLAGEAVIRDVASTRVFFLELTESEIEEYTRSGESLDKAGAYAIQGRASKFVLRLDGCYHNVVGLPVSLVYRHLKSL